MSDSHAHPDAAALPDDPEVPIADALEQARVASADAPREAPVPRLSRLSDDIEVPDADAWEQAQTTPEHDEY